MTMQNVVGQGLIGANEARVNITWAGQNADLPDPISIDLSDNQIMAMVTEAIRGGIPGIAADPDANLEDFVVQRFDITEARPYKLMSVRPKTPFG